MRGIVEAIDARAERTFTPSGDSPRTILTGALAKQSRGEFSGKNLIMAKAQV
jgi:hypothetical protein